MRSNILKCMFLLLVLGTTVYAQVDQGQIAGTVMDTSGAVVPGAKLTVLHTQTGTSQSAVAGQNGSYIITNVGVGDYTVSAEAAGFKKYTRTNVRVDAATRTTVDITLDVGLFTESVTVVGTFTQMQAETAQIGRVVESRQITDLALNGRNPINLALLKAGVSGGAFNTFNPDSLTNGGFSINGGDVNSNAVTMDGVNIVRTRNGDNSVGEVNVDVLQEVQVLTSSYPAEYGRTKDGQIRFVSKSGTRDFHGTAYEFFRNSALDANTWTRNQSPRASDSSQPAPFRFNQPGFSFGGPIFIPGKFNTGRSKLFFLLSEEWIRFRQESNSTTTVPSLLMRQGDFSELLNSNNPFFNAVKIVRDPSNGQPYPNNIIPVPRLSHNGMALMSAYPLPTPGFQLGTSNWIGSGANPRNSRKDFYRLDYYAGKNRITFSGNNFSYHADDAFYNSWDIAPTRWDRPNRSATITATSTLSPTVVNEASFSAGEDIVKLGLHETNGKALWERSLYGVNFPFIYPAAEKIVPDRFAEKVAVTGFTTLDANNRPSNSSGPMFTWADNFTWVQGSAHTFKFGVNVAREQDNNNDQTNDENGNMTFLDTGNPLTTGVAIANLALGNFNTYGETGTSLYTLSRSTALEAYAQDTWKASPKLTVELGVRYSYYQPWYAKWNDLANFSAQYFDPNNLAVVSRAGGYITSGNPYNGLVLPGAGYPPGAAGRFPGTTNPATQPLFHNLPRGLVNSYKNAFAPRLGIAYRIGGKTVIRVGGGVFHQRQFQDTSALIKMPPNIQRSDVVNGHIDNPGGNLGSINLFTIQASSWDAKVPTADNYSFSIQRQLAGAMLLDVSYVGKTGAHLIRNSNVNQLQPGTLQANPGVNANALRPYLGLGQFSLRAYSGHSAYNGLQVSLDRRFSSGLGFGMAYTFSKNINDVGTPYDAFRAYLMKSVAGADRTHVLNVNLVYELPFLHSQRGLMGNAFGGWQLSPVVFFRSGSPMSVTDSTDVAGVGPGSAAGPWNLVGSTAVSGNRGLNKLWFNTAAFTLPTAGTFGNAGIDILRGPMFQNWDISLFKHFRIVEKLTSEVRLELFNFLNHGNLDNPSTNPRSGAFGMIVSKTGTRQVQLGLKFIF